jgi:hypothetical protein
MAETLPSRRATIWVMAPLDPRARSLRSRGHPDDRAPRWPSLAHSLPAICRHRYRGDSPTASAFPSEAKFRRCQPTWRIAPTPVPGHGSPARHDTVPWCDRVIATSKAVQPAWAAPRAASG